MFFPQVISADSSHPVSSALTHPPPFETYRPRSHFIAPHSWANDPCGAVYIPETKEYMIAIQWNPGTTTAGNSAWALARSKDLVTWHDCQPALLNGLNTDYDSCGVFSGSIYSRLLEGKRILYLFYTSISTFPYPHWSKEYTFPESQSLCYSTDFGRSWHRYQHNPLLVDAPSQSFTTGWRDPFVSDWAALSELRGVNAETKYMLVASGDKRSGPQLLIYESQDLIDWTPLAVLFQGQADLPIALDSTLNHGRNFECGSFFTIKGRHYITVGVEQHPSQTTRHSHRYTLWMSGKLQLNANGNPSFVVSTFARLDPGIMYAPHIFCGPKDEVLQLGWADEDQNSLTEQQGWAGCLTFPRELCNVQLPISETSLSEKHMWELDHAAGTMATLGIRPALQMKGLRASSKQHDLDSLFTLRSKTFEIEATFNYLSGNETLTFNVRQSPHDREVTRIVISLPQSAITVDRSASSLTNGSSEPDEGTFQLFPDGTTQTPYMEPLHVRIFVDNSIIEVYANDRFALSSRIYPTLDTALGVSCDFRTGNGAEKLCREKVTFECWEGLVNAWPGRESAREDIVDVVGDKSQVQVSEAHLQAVSA
jgi:beta-fructofuranosidase